MQAPYLLWWCPWLDPLITRWTAEGWVYSMVSLRRPYIWCFLLSEVKAILAKAFWYWDYNIPGRIGSVSYLLMTWLLGSPLSMKSLISVTNKAFTKADWYKGIDELQSQFCAWISFNNLDFLYAIIAHQCPTFIGTYGSLHPVENSGCNCLFMPSQITRFIRPTWGPAGADRSQVGPMRAPWTILSGMLVDFDVCVLQHSINENYLISSI